MPFGRGFDSRRLHHFPDADIESEGQAISVNQRLIELARQIQEWPWNDSGSDKTWVLEAMRQSQLFAQEVREAQRVETR